MLIKWSNTQFATQTLVVNWAGKMPLAQNEKYRHGQNENK